MVDEKDTKNLKAGKSIGSGNPNANNIRDTDELESIDDMRDTDEFEAYHDEYEEGEYEDMEDIDSPIEYQDRLLKNNKGRDVINDEETIKLIKKTFTRGKKNVTYNNAYDDDIMPIITAFNDIVNHAAYEEDKKEIVDEEEILNLLIIATKIKRNLDAGTQERLQLFILAIDDLLDSIYDNAEYKVQYENLFNANNLLRNVDQFKARYIARMESVPGDYVSPLNNAYNYMKNIGNKSDVTARFDVGYVANVPQAVDPQMALVKQKLIKLFRGFVFNKVTPLYPKYSPVYGISKKQWDAATDTFKWLMRTTSGTYMPTGALHKDFENLL